MLDYVPGRSNAPAPPAPDTSLPKAVFPWVVARLAARRRDDLPISEQSLRADLALGFAAQLDCEAVWPEDRYAGEGSARLGVLVRRPEPDEPVAVASAYARRADPGQASLNARQLGDLLRDALRLHRAFGTGGLPVQVLLCTDEFRSYLAALRPPLRLLRPDSPGADVRADLPLDDIEDATRHRLGDLLGTQPVAVLRLTLDVLAYAPVGALHLGMWRVVDARLI